ncbi:hypothetical protein THOE12_110087 [Vibrio rotiferianus]|nr:hypothetical protein THOE12_110087 [Vibrio rotiferianus]
MYFLLSFLLFNYDSRHYTTAAADVSHLLSEFGSNKPSGQKRLSANNLKYFCPITALSCYS